MNTNKKENTSQPKQTFVELIKSGGCSPNMIDLNALGDRQNIVKSEKKSVKPLHNYSVVGIRKSSLGWAKEVPGKNVRIYFKESEQCAKFWAMAEENGLTYDEACAISTEEMKKAVS